MSDETLRRVAALSLMIAVALGTIALSAATPRISGAAAHPVDQLAGRSALLGTATPAIAAPDAASGPSAATATPLPVHTPRSTQVILQPLTPTPYAGQLFDQAGEVRDHFVLARPFVRDPTDEIKDYPARSYAYGSKGGGGFATHHGLDYQNRTGTTILAVADGWVVYAGDDLTVEFGPRPNFYGRLVVIEHDVTAPDGRPLYTLYGHMLRTEVEAGQRVQQGARLGQVGATGVALGSHLHLEVRVGDAFDYYSTYNPDLWIRPWPRYGVLAGRIYDRAGNRLYGATIAILTAYPGGPSRYTYSYEDDAVNPDPYYGEHFTYADLPVGDYQVIVRINQALRFQEMVTIEDRQTNWIEIRLN